MSMKLNINGTDSSWSVNTVVEDWGPAIRSQNLIADIIAIKYGYRKCAKSFITRWIKHLEEACFCPTVGIDGFVKIQVLMGNIGNDGHIEVASTYTLQFESMRSCFNHRMGSTCFYQATQKLLNV